MGKRRKKPTVTERAAYHEAGHVVMAYLSRRRFRYATIDQNELDEETRGFVRLSSLSGESSDRGSSKIYGLGVKGEREVTIALAGAVAEGLLVGRDSWKNAREDGQKCYDLCSSKLGSMEQIDAYLNWLWVRVRDELKLKLNWFLVRVVAEALLKHRRISYQKARTIIEEAESNYRKNFQKRLKKHKQ